MLRTRHSTHCFQDCMHCFQESMHCIQDSMHCVQNGIHCIQYQYAMISGLHAMLAKVCIAFRTACIAFRTAKGTIKHIMGEYWAYKLENTFVLFCCLSLILDYCASSSSPSFWMPTNGVLVVHIGSGVLGWLVWLVGWLRGCSTICTTFRQTFARLADCKQHILTSSSPSSTSFVVGHCWLLWCQLLSQFFAFITPCPRKSCKRGRGGP